MLTLHENLFLLGLHEEKVALMHSAAEGLLVGLAGALLADLAFLNRIESDHKHRIRVISEEQTGETFLDETLAMLHKNSSAKKVHYWLDQIELKPKHVASIIIQQLTSKGVLKDEDGVCEWVTPYPPKSEMNASAKFSLKRRLRTLGLTQAEPEIEEVALLGLLKACDELELVFFKDERKLASRRIYELVMSEALRTPAVQILQEIQEALESKIQAD